MPAHLRLAISNGIILEPPRPVVVEFPPRPAVTAPPAPPRPAWRRRALNLAAGFAAVAAYLAVVHAFFPE
jgi:hypothetical protein